MFLQFRFILAGLLFGLVAGCATVPADWGRAQAIRTAADHGLPVAAVDDIKAFTQKTLAAPLTVASAVQIALVNNPQLRLESARLGFAAAELYEAGRLANPAFSLTRLSPGGAGSMAAQLTMDVAVNFVRLLFLPANRRFAEDRLEAAKLAMASGALQLASDVEAAWYQALGADQLMQMRNASENAQRASAALAQRYFEAGNISQRQLALEQAAASQAALAALSARAQAAESRGALNRLMGLAADADDWTLATRLPLPSDETLSIHDLQKIAFENRLDLQALRKNAQAIADRFGFVRKTRFVEGVQIGLVRERDYDGAISIGPTLSFDLPLFDWGGASETAARAALEQVEAELDARVLDASNGVRRTLTRLEQARASADEYRNHLIPSRETAVARAQEEQNYMLIGAFELIQAKQLEYDAYAGYIEAVRDYWVARSELDRQVGRRLPAASAGADSVVDTARFLKPQPSASAHAHHTMPGMAESELNDTQQTPTGDQP